MVIHKILGFAELANAGPSSDEFVANTEQTRKIGIKQREKVLRKDIGYSGKDIFP